MYPIIRRKISNAEAEGSISSHQKAGQSPLSRTSLWLCWSRSGLWPEDTMFVSQKTSLSLVCTIGLFHQRSKWVRSGIASIRSDHHNHTSPSLSLPPRSLPLQIKELLDKAETLDVMDPMFDQTVLRMEEELVPHMKEEERASKPGVDLSRPG